MTARPLLRISAWLVLAAWLVAVPARAQQPIVLTVETVTGEPGEEVLVPIEITDLNGQMIQSYQFDFVYDPALLSIAEFSSSSDPDYQDATSGTFSQGKTVIGSQRGTDRFRIGAFGLSAGATGTLVKLPVTLGAAGTGTIAIEVAAPTNAQFTTNPVQVVVTDDPNNAPVVTDEIDDQTLSVGGVFMRDLSTVFSDEDADALAFTATSSAASFATVATTDGVLTVTPVAEGTATITVTADDGELTATTTFDVTVEAANRAPVAVDDEATTTEDTAVEIDVLANDTDADGDTLTLRIVLTPENGTAEVTGETITYTPAPDFAGTDRFVYAVVDEAGAEAGASAVITVTPVNDPPAFADEAVIVNPPDDARLVIGGTTDEPADPAQSFVIDWVAAEDPEEAEVTYTWQLAATEDFAEPLFTAETGTETELATTFGALAALLDSAGVGLDASVELYHRVLASDGALQTSSGAYNVVLVRGAFTAAEDGRLPGAYALGQNYPNPFNPRTTIAYSLPEAADVTVRVYDVAGKEVATLISARQGAGAHSVVFDAAGLPSGTYLYRIDAGSFSASRSMTLLK